MKRFCVLAAMVALAVSPSLADDKKAEAKSPVSMNEKEQAFADLMQDAVLVGNFSVNRERPGKDPSKLTPERYGIKSITKKSGNEWTVNSNIKYGQLDVTVPVPVEVHFANDTPVLCVTDLSIPLVGEGFTARVMFFDNQYAGTWRHGKVGGLMYGRVEKAKPEEKAADVKPDAGKPSAPATEAADKPARGKQPSATSSGPNIP